MRFAIISDIHGNYEALQAVIDDIDEIRANSSQEFDGVWCLGDIVGYGPDPGACVRTIRHYSSMIVAGNHDWGACGKADLNEFSETARASLLWTQRQLRIDEIDFLANLPDRATAPDPENMTMVHGSPVVPLWEYLLTPEAASLSFLSFPTRFCVVGHTHVPTIFLQESAKYDKLKLPVLTARERQVMEYGSEEEGIIASTIEMDAIMSRPPCIPMQTIPQGWWMPDEKYRAIVNPGSVGQPRDGDNRAAYVIYDTEKGFLFRRVQYWKESTIEKLKAESFTKDLIERLLTGY